MNPEEEIKVLKQQTAMMLKLLEDVCKASVDLDKRLRYLESELGVAYEEDRVAGQK